jgi:D-threonine aldolase
MSNDYFLHRPDDLLSPSLVVFRPIVERNLAAMLRVAGSADRLRPHCKTHKMPALVKMLLRAGIRRHKAATVAEVEMLAEAGVQDVVLAYNPVGPNIARVVALKTRYPDLRLGVTADHPKPLAQLSAALGEARTSIEVYLDVNPGRNRTGLEPGEEALRFYQTIDTTPNLVPAGFHIYDGHFHQPDPKDRRAALLEKLGPIQELRDRLVRAGCRVPKMICGGTPSFMVYATMDDPAIELSPGTCIFHDGNYSAMTDLSVFQPAALLFTRVVSRPRPNLVTLDLGTKSVASDPPMGQRVSFSALPDGKQVLHNEEHLVIETPDADRFQPDDWLLGIPRHVCPCSALHKEAIVVANGEVVDSWPVVARDRRLTI